MKTDEVKKLHPMERFLYWVQERESVRLKKEAGEPRPWTDDEILQKYRFCNVRRMDDRVSRWLLENWYTPHYDHQNMIVACTLARQLNNIESLAAVGFPKVWNPEKVEKILVSRVDRGLKNFSAAYMITGTLGGTKIEQIVYKVVDPISKKKRELKGFSTMQGLWRRLLPFAGFSTFIAGQVVADMRWACIGPWDDRYYWAPIGPGSRRGMNRLNGLPLKATIKDRDFDLQLQEIIALCHSEVSVDITSRMEAIDYQNCLCEYDKYERTLHGEGKPKRLYR